MGATQQYYPLLHSAFGSEHQLWGDSVLGYHLVNILLHAAAAVMVAMILRRLAIPGAYLAAAIFALHPVNVESVAWITELKNTLSAVFYLGAMLAYLRFRPERGSWRGTACALGLFLLGLLSKTVTATLPAALLVIFWWQRGAAVMAARRAAASAVFRARRGGRGLFTAWVERKLIGAEGPAFDLTVVERGLIAGPGDLVLPGQAALAGGADLHLSALAGEPGGVVAIPVPGGGAVVWLLLCGACGGVGAGRWRACCSSSARSFPVLGFFNVYPFIYSYRGGPFPVPGQPGDHHAGLGRRGAVLLGRWRLWDRPAGYALCLACWPYWRSLTWRQSRMYADVETLYRTTIERNPACSMAHYNLGVLLFGQGRADEAMPQFQKTLELKPESFEAYNNIGLILARRGLVDEAITQYRRALKIKPYLRGGPQQPGHGLGPPGPLGPGDSRVSRCAQTKPDFAEAHCNLGFALAAQDRLHEAMAEYRKAHRNQAGLRRGTQQSGQGAAEERAN